MALIRNLIDAHAALDAKEGAQPPLSASAARVIEGGRAPQPDRAVGTFGGKRPTQHDLARDALVQAIEHGVLSPKTAFGDVFPFPYSAVDGRAYHGQNILTLAVKAQAAGYSTGAWMTFSAATKQGWRVRKGEHHAKVFLHKQKAVATDEVDEETGDPVVKQVPMLRHFQVFNIAQLVKDDGSPVTEADVAARRDAVPAGRKPTAESVQLLHRIAEGMGIEIAYDPAARKAQLEECTLTVPAKAGDTSNSTVSHLARALIRLSVSEAIPRAVAPDPEQVEPLRDAAFNLRVAMAEAIATMHLGFPIEGSRPFDVMDLDRLLAKDKRAGRMAAGDAEQAVRYMLSFDPSLRYPLRSEEEQLREEVLDAVGDDVMFDAGEIDFDYVEARSGVRMKP